MKNKWKIILIVFLLLPIMVGFSACSCNGSDGDNNKNGLTYTVRFYTNTDETFNIPAQNIQQGRLARRPDNPDKEGYTFVGWYSSPTLSDESIWRFESNTVTMDITLYARWEAKDNSGAVYFTVRFQTNSEETANITPQSVKEGNLVRRPDNPIKNGYIFIGWYYSHTFEEGTEWKFDSKTVTGDVTLYAKWELKK